MRILLLEDDAETSDAIEQGCHNESHAISVARDAPSAGRLVEAERFDAAVLDVMVPGGSGYGVLERLRSRAPGARSRTASRAWTAEPTTIW